MFAALFLATWWRPPWPAEQAMHHSLTVLGVALLVWGRWRQALPFASLLAGLGFLALHTVAARWLYSNVPYDAWTEALSGARLSERLGWRRNHTDRLVHLAYGLCLAPIVAGYLRTTKGWRIGPAAACGVGAVLATGAVYEIAEWLVAATLSPQAAEAYNGQQGDPWDAQKDMALAALGALVGTGCWAGWRIGRSALRARVTDLR